MSSTTPAQVSACISARNEHPAHLKATVRSLFEAGIEDVVVVFDGSEPVSLPDEVRQEASPWRGLSSARERAVRLAANSTVLLIDAHSWLPPATLDAMIRQFDAGALIVGATHVPISGAALATRDDMDKVIVDEMASDSWAPGNTWHMQGSDGSLEWTHRDMPMPPVMRGQIVRGGCMLVNTEALVLDLESGPTLLDTGLLPPWGGRGRRVELAGTLSRRLRRSRRRARGYRVRRRS